MLKLKCAIGRSSWLLQPNLYSARLISRVTSSKGFRSPTYINATLSRKILQTNVHARRKYSFKGNSANQNFGKSKVIIIAATAATAGILAIWYVTRKQPHENVQNQETKMPARSSDIPKKVPYLLIGGGTASFSAFRAIKSSDPTAKVLIITNEDYFPYMRPPLSKEVWFQSDYDVSTKLNFKQWNGSERSMFFEPEEFYIAINDLENEPKGGIAVARGWTVTSIDAENKKVILEDGTQIEYDKCLLATGVRAKNLPIFENSKQEIQNKISLFRNIDDFKRVYDAVKAGAKSVIIVGSSLLGSELACALSKNESSEVKVVQIFPENGILENILPKYLSSWTTETIRSQGVEIIANADVEKVSLSPNKNQIELTLNNNNKVSGDYIIVATDSIPNTDIAKHSNLEIHPQLGGFVVNSELEARSDLYAAGDCACYYDSLFGRRRIENHDHAVTSGRLAGENMTGARKLYTHQPMFWSELGPEIGLEAVGIVDSSLQTVAVFAKSDDQIDDEKNKNPSNDKSISDINISVPKKGDDYSKGVIFYLRDDLIVGIVLWNVFNRITIARQVLKERKKFGDMNEVAKLFHIHSD